MKFLLQFLFVCLFYFFFGRGWGCFGWIIIMPLASRRGFQYDIYGADLMGCFSWRVTDKKLKQFNETTSQRFPSVTVICKVDLEFSIYLLC